LKNKKSCYVGFVLITKIELKVETEEAVVKQGDTLNIIAEITPDNATEKKLDWTTSDEEIAKIKIDEENLTATIEGVKAGVVTIIASATDGTTILGYSDSTGITDTVGRIVEETNKVNAISVDKSSTEKNYVVHPAFRNGDTGDENTSYKNGEWNSEISGIWVAKFEASFEGSETTAASGQYNGTAKTLQSKPGSINYRQCIWYI